MSNEEQAIVRADKLLGAVMKRIHSYGDKGPRGLATGFTSLDRILRSGLEGGRLIVAAGHQYVGTTAFALRIAEHLSIDSGVSVLYFTLDTGREVLVERMLLSRAKVDSHAAHHGKFSEDDLVRMEKAASEMLDKPLYVEDTPRLTPSEVRVKAKELKDSKGVKCIIVDFLQAMHLNGKADLQQKDFEEISRELKLMALELNVPVILLVELCFDLIRKEEMGCQPRMADLGKAIMVERFADVLSLINRPGFYYTESPVDNRVELVVTRNKYGPTGDARLEFKPGYGRFENPDYTEWFRLRDKVNP